ncbi:DUF2784 domain-containing protein [Parazoarcus communis]|uniref:DUF2784 domain-containing protein n=1 Tax=Parazoarcus communis SWub3 = DSM 12120 TaxID=1121029 RepID=A0A323V8F6_9RHOO|nr:DUF2784 domain-containing protein [Parazoarcus communis]NMG72687.1 DUF2784 family protein [Parazoarcus communis SWub3 = DSM 12120]PZA16478.1 DUF2784 domain-containing protein [Azoarcus communis] [Parazoarcus communis SWub3 = DSM 12120]
MTYRLAADAVLVLHLAFILFVLAGGLPVLRWPRVAFAHLPAAAWGIHIELSGGLCPLTPLENTLRARAGQAGYEGSFIEHYLLPVIYPDGLTRELQLALAGTVVVVNVAVYSWVLWRRGKAPSR